MRRDHRNRCPDLSKPMAISFCCSVGLHVEPLEAFVPLYFFHILGALADQWTDAVDRRQDPFGNAERAPQRLHRPTLQRLERVQENAHGLRIALPDVHHGLAHLIFGVLQQFLDEMRR
uniref:Uncharacterized protein n=1 Tax=Triticum urartu TaxID=4572 RepID=A0A8R7PYC4_TRIUA